MGETKKLIKQELKTAFFSVFSHLTEEEQQLTSKEKIILRNCIEELSQGKLHLYSHIFIERKIKEILEARRNTNDDTETSSIIDLVNDEYGEENETQTENSETISEKTES
jgi:hypothetical protein